MAYVAPYVRYTPVGEYLRLLILRRLAEGPASVEEINELVKKSIEKLNIKYSWQIWPRLLLPGEIEIKGDKVMITQRGRWIMEQTSDEVVEYVKRMLGVSL